MINFWDICRLLSAWFFLSTSRTEKINVSHLCHSVIQLSSKKCIHKFSGRMASADTCHEYLCLRRLVSGDVRCPKASGQTAACFAPASFIAPKALLRGLAKDKATETHDGPCHYAAPVHPNNGNLGLFKARTIRSASAFALPASPLYFFIYLFSIFATSFFSRWIGIGIAKYSLANQNTLYSFLLYIS